MNESFQRLIESVEQTGSTRNDILILEENIAKIHARTSALNMESIENDLKQVRTENSKLMSRLREAAAEKSVSVEHLLNSVLGDDTVENIDPVRPRPSEVAPAAPVSDQPAQLAPHNPLANPISDPLS
jgi:regulator of replication initiation timing